MDGVWWPSRCSLDRKHEHCTWWQQETLPNVWWNHPDVCKHEHDFWARGSCWSFSCHSITLRYGLYAASWNGMANTVRLLEDKSAGILPRRTGCPLLFALIRRIDRCRYGTLLKLHQNGMLRNNAHKWPINCVINVKTLEFFIKRVPQQWN